nr:triose-phosphate isomerase [uncultured Campylobacter sp.]
MILAANLKCNHTRASFERYAKALDEGLAGLISREDEILVFPPASAFYAKAKNFTQGAQNFYPAAHGSFTGEIGGDMLAEFDVKTVLIGHSERRAILGENAELIREKFSFAAAQGWRIVFCVGEDEAAFAQDRSEGFVAAQLEGIDLKYPSLVLAYEPVWAIGTGRSAQREQIERMLNLLRVKSPAPLLYGGSVNAENIAKICAIKGCNGVLVGTASWDASSFLELIRVVSHRYTSLP